MGTPMRYQPQGLQRLNRQSRFGRLVTAAFSFGKTFRSVVNQRRDPIITGKPSFVGYPGGLAALGDGSSYINTGILPAEIGCAGASARTFVADFYMADANGGKAVFSLGDSSGTQQSQFTLLTNSNYREVSLQTYNVDIAYSPYTTSGTGARVFLAIVYDGVKTINFYSWAKLDSTGQVVFNSLQYVMSGPLNTGNTVPLYLMGGGTYGFPAIVTPLYYLAVFGGVAMPLTDIQALYQDNTRWSLWESGSANSAYQSAIATQGAASASTNVTPAPGALTLAGYAPTVAQTANQSVTPGTGTLAVSGYAPTVSQTSGQNVMPTAGAVSLTGYPPAIAQTANQSVQPGVGALALTGYAPQVSQSANQAIAPGAGTVALTGYAPSVAQTTGNSVLLQPGVLTLTGFAPSVAQSANIAVAPDPGALTITGYAPSVTQIGSIAVSPAAGALSIAGYAPTVTQSSSFDGADGGRPRKRKPEPAIEAEQPVSREDAELAKKKLQALSRARDEKDRRTAAARDDLRQALRPAPIVKPAPAPVRVAPPSLDEDDEEELLLLLI